MQEPASVKELLVASKSSMRWMEKGGSGRQAAPGMSLLDRQKLDRILLPFLFGLNEQLLSFVSYAGDHRIPNPEAEWQDDGDRIHLSHVCSACGASPAYALLHRGKVQRFPGAPRVSLGSRFPLHRGWGCLFTVQLQGRVACQPHVKDTGDHFVTVVACRGLRLASQSVFLVTICWLTSVLFTTNEGIAG